MDRIISAIASQLSIAPERVEAVVKLLGDGATVPFISRYRKEATGALDEVAVRKIETELARQRALEERRQTVIQTIEAAGAMTDALRRQIDSASTATEIEDIYAPFKVKRRTRGAVAREKGLEPLAKQIMAGRIADVQSAASRYAGKNGVSGTPDAISGAQDIIAEWAADSTRLRNMTRNSYRRNASIVTSAAKDAALSSTPFAQYGDFSQPVRRISSHQYLALRRAEREGLIKVKYDLGDEASRLSEALVRAYTPQLASPSCADVIAGAVEDAARRLLRPSVENEISAALKEDADRVAIDIFSANLRQLLLSSPLKGLRIIALDPGFRTGCKTVVLDAQGNLLDDTVIYPVPPRNDFAGASRTLRNLIEKYKIDAIAIGDGTASQETRSFVAGSGLIDPNRIFIVSESGASVYSASDIARDEFPDKDVTVRGAVSIGRRLIDPLAELVKVDPKAIGVGQYQHDVDQKKLKDALDYTVMSCVNAVGVDINTASARLLSYISGIGPALASNIVAYRAANGDFTDRAHLLRVPRLGEKAYTLAAGFLRVPGAANPLDNTGIHPESYHVVEAMARSISARTSDLPANTALLDRISPDALAAQGIAGKETIADIIAELRKPGRDPRLDTAQDDFRPEITSFDDLRPGMILHGKVNNITAFGAFVDLGIHESGLVHISQLADRRVAAVSDVLALGDIVKVKVLDTDPVRRRISLSIKEAL